MNRHQRRALAKTQGNRFGEAAVQLQQTIDALQAQAGQIPGQVTEAQRLMGEAHAMVSALVEDYQNMSDELTALKAMLFPEPEDRQIFEQKVAELRAQRTPGSV